MRDEDHYETIKYHNRHASTILIAHRGFIENDEVAENSTTSFLDAAKLRQFTGIETDVQETSDGHFVVFHDKYLDTKTDGRGRVRKHTFRYIENCHYFNGAHIPTFEDYLSICAKYHKRAFIELKRLKRDDLGRLLAIIRYYHMSHRTTFVSSYRWYIRGLRKIDSRVPIFYIIKKHPPYLRHFNFARKMHCGIDGSMDYSGVIQLYLASLYKVPYAVWTANDRHSIEKFKKRGVRIITSNVKAY